MPHYIKMYYISTVADSQISDHGYARTDIKGTFEQYNILHVKHNWKKNGRKKLQTILTDFHGLKMKQSSHYPFQICIQKKHICYHLQLVNPGAAYTNKIQLAPHTLTYN